VKHDSNLLGLIWVNLYISRLAYIQIFLAYSQEEFAHNLVMVLAKSLPLGEKLRLTRETRGLTLDRLSAAAGVNIGTISRIESGATKDPGIRSSNKLANALEISPAFLTSTEDDELEFTVALRLQSLRKFLVLHPFSDEHERSLKQLCFFDSAPNSVQGWQDLMHNANYLFEHGILR